MNIIRPPTLRGYFTLAFSLLIPLFVLAQDPNLALDDLRFTRDFAAAHHLIAQVSMETQRDKYLRYRYDSYSNVRQITTADGISYAQPKGKAWIKSNDWGETGTRIKPDKARELDTFATIAEEPIADPPVGHDKSQGEAVWKLIEQTKTNDYELFTYERNRERPNSGGVYPRYRFIKYKNDSDGNLVLEHFSGQMLSESGPVPIEIKYDFMIAFPGATIQVVPGKTKSSKQQ